MKRIIEGNKILDDISPAIYNIGSDNDSPRMENEAFSPPKMSIMGNASGLIKTEVNPHVDIENMDKTPKMSKN
tara:strand:- start:2223 stop:2441 length:219 start_codon:yes stop_codon:yes gene_type:complete